MKNTMTTILLGALTLTCQAGDCKPKAHKNIVETAAAAGTFKTLTAALGAADLATALKGAGPFTVFAPTDAAFAKLPKGTVASLLKPENKSKLQAILKYHVVSGNVDLSGALKAGHAPTLQGESVSIGFANGKVNVNNATLLTADLRASNGVIHVIDSVLLPPEPKNDILAVAKNAGQFKTLLTAVEAAGLTSVLTGKDPVTVLAPTDAAFKALPEGTIKLLLNPVNKKRLTKLLSLHVVKGSVTAGTALNAGDAKSVDNQDLKFAISNGTFQVNGVTIVKTDIKCDNGIIHVLDAILDPYANKTAMKTDPAKMIENAVSKGSSIFNQGDADKCVKIYQNCMTSLVRDSKLDPSTRRMIIRVSTEASKTHCPTSRAWALRRGLDNVYATVTKKH